MCQPNTVYLAIPRNLRHAEAEVGMQEIGISYFYVCAFDIRPLHDPYQYDNIRVELMIFLERHAQGHSNVANRQ